MRLSIIPCDKSVYIDGVSYLDIDMSWVPKIEGKEVHAVQWSDNEGEVEFVGNFQNLKIKELGVFEKAIKLWNVKKSEAEKLQQQRLEEEERLLMEQEEQKRAELEMFVQFELEARELEAQARDFEKQRLELEEAAAAVALELEAAAAATAAALKAEEEYQLAMRAIPASVFAEAEEKSDLGEGESEIIAEDVDDDEDLFFDIEELLREI
jgi:hypothetical protein